MGRTKPEPLSASSKIKARRIMLEREGIKLEIPMNEATMPRNDRAATGGRQ